MNICRCWIGVFLCHLQHSLHTLGEREREKSGDADPWQVQNPEEQEGNAVLPGRCVAIAMVQLTLLILQTHKPTIWGLVLPPINWWLWWRLLIGFYVLGFTTHLLGLPHYFSLVPFFLAIVVSLIPFLAIWINSFAGRDGDGCLVALPAGRVLISSASDGSL